MIEFAAEMYRPLVRCDQRAKGEQYVRGLLLEGRRKSIQPMAARLPDRDEHGLQQFITDSPWEDEPVRRRLARRMTPEIEPEGWIVDDTGLPKDGSCEQMLLQRRRSLDWGRRVAGAFAWRDARDARGAACDCGRNACRPDESDAGGTAGVADARWVPERTVNVTFWR